MVYRRRIAHSRTVNTLQRSISAKEPSASVDMSERRLSCYYTNESPKYDVEINTFGSINDPAA